MISFKGVQTETRDGNTVYYYRTRKGRRIRLPDDKSSENFAAAVRLAATIGEGVKRTKRPSGASFPHQVQVTQIEAFPPESELPDWDDLRGMAPDATGELSSEAFIRELRDGWY